MQKKYTLKAMTTRIVPYTIRKAHKKDCFRVMNKKTRRVFAKCTTHNNAIKQDKLLRALMYNKTFRRYPK